MIFVISYYNNPFSTRVYFILKLDCRMVSSILPDHRSMINSITPNSLFFIKIQVQYTYI